MSQDKLLGDRYRPRKKMGRRALGDSFGAQDVQLDRTVVLEVLQGPMLATPESRLPPETLQRLKADLEALAQLQSPYLLNVLDVQAAGRPPFLVFEPVTGDPLPVWLQSQQLRGEELEEVLEKLTRDLLEGLDTMHRAGLTHKDIRPATVFRTSGGDFLLMEPGLTQAPGLREALHPSVVAQLAPFLPPEVSRGEPAGPHSDLYQLGAVLRFVATGTLPREGQAPPPMAQQAPELREAWQIFVDELQAQNLGQRIQTVAAASEFQDMMLAEEAALEAGLAPGGAAPGLPGPPDPARVSPLRPVILALVVLGLIFGVFFTGKGEEVLPTLASEAEVGLEELRYTWKVEAVEDGPTLEGPLTLEVDELEDRVLEPQDGVYQLQAPWKELQGKPFRLRDTQGRTLATDQFPGGIQDFRTSFRTHFLPDGSIRVELDCTHSVSLAVRYQEGGQARDAASEGTKRSHQQVFRPGWEKGKGIQAIQWSVTGPLGVSRPLQGPEGFPAHRPFFKKALKELDDLVPFEVVKALKTAVKSATDHAVTVEIPGWPEVRKRWNEEPLFRRLRFQGDVYFSALKEVGIGKLYEHYEDLLKLERINTGIAAVTPHDPLETREIFRAFCHHFQPDERRGSRALAPGTGEPIMMQYVEPAPSWLNEDGKKTWPSNFETQFALPPRFYTPGARARFTVAVEDVSPLYRMELFLQFQHKGEQISRSFWFYPLRNMQRLAAKEEPAQMLMAVEVPVELIPEAIGNLKLEVDKLGYWGGHGGTTFQELLLEKIEPEG